MNQQKLYLIYSEILPHFYGGPLDPFEITIMNPDMSLKLNLKFNLK